MSRYLESGVARTLEDDSSRLLESGPDVPANVVATATSKTTITLTWSAYPGAIGYDVERNAVVIATNYPASPYLDTGLTGNTTYNYRVRAVLF